MHKTLLFLDKLRAFGEYHQNVKLKNCWIFFEKRTLYILQKIFKEISIDIWKNLEICIPIKRYVKLAVGSWLLLWLTLYWKQCFLQFRLNLNRELMVTFDHYLGCILLGIARFILILLYMHCKICFRLISNLAL